jgi:hypothetical protein
MKNMILPVILAFVLTPAALVYADLTADEIVQKVDEVRNPELDYQTDVKVVSYKPNRPEHASL